MTGTSTAANGPSAGTGGTIVAVAGGKGGCGKTTTTLGLARAAARNEDGTSDPAGAAAPAALAVDADADMPDLHRAAGVDRTPGLDADPRPAVQRPADAPGVGVVAAPTDGDASPAALSRCRSLADLVLVDCPAGAGRDAADPLRAADAAVLVTTPSPTCLRDTARTAAMARALGTPVAGTVVSRADDPPDGLESLLAAPLAAVPAVSAPLSATPARRAYDRALSALLATGPTGNPARSPPT